MESAITTTLVDDNIGPVVLSFDGTGLEVFTIGQSGVRCCELNARGAAHQLTRVAVSDSWPPQPRLVTSAAKFLQIHRRPSHYQDISAR